MGLETGLGQLPGTYPSLLDLGQVCGTCTSPLVLAQVCVVLLKSSGHGTWDLVLCHWNRGLGETLETWTSGLGLVSVRKVCGTWSSLWSLAKSAEVCEVLGHGTMDF